MAKTNCVTLTIGYTVVGQGGRGALPDSAQHAEAKSRSVRHRVRHVGQRLEHAQDDLVPHGAPRTVRGLR